MENRTKFTDAELALLEIKEGQGGGRTDEKTYQIKQFPFPIDDAKEIVDIRIRPKILGGD